MTELERLREIQELAEERGREAAAARDRVRERRWQKLRPEPEVDAEVANLALPPDTGADRFAGVLVAEGDSWFDYPGADVLDLLEDSFGYVVEDVARKGHRVEAMAYDDAQLIDFTRLIDRVLRRGEAPKAILLSGGGNDIAGTEFALLIDHANSYTPGINSRIVEGVIDHRLKEAYISIISAVQAVAHFRMGRVIPVVIHGYGYAVPDGRGVLGGFGPLPGPWLEPGFRGKGYHDLAKNTAVIRELIDRFNAMLASLPSLFPEGAVRYVDLTRLLPNSFADYRSWWANELHPTSDGFYRVAKAIAEAIESL